MSIFKESFRFLKYVCLFIQIIPVICALFLINSTIMNTNHNHSVFVFGATGFIGSHLISRLSKEK